MEVLLTPVVNRLLKRFVKSAEGRSGSSLRVSLSGGSVVLHNLELNLEPLLQNLPITVERAFARELKIRIPWASLATQPIQAMTRMHSTAGICHYMGVYSEYTPPAGAPGHSGSGDWLKR